MNESDIAKNILLDKTCLNCMKSGLMCKKLDRESNTYEEWVIFTKIKVVRSNYPSMTNKETEII